MWRVGIAALLVAGLASPAFAESERTLNITEGIVPYQVVQCDAHDRGVFECKGTTSLTGQGVVEARVKRAKGKARHWSDVGKAANGTWNARIDDVPVGGPYTLELRLKTKGGKAKVSVPHLLVGDLWILSGQSNMQGVGDNLNVEQPDEHVNIFAMNDHWRLAEEPLHRLNESRDIVHSGVKDDAKRNNLVADESHWTKGAGLGLAFAKDVYKKTGRPIGLVPCAHGGTSMTQWDPKLRDEGGKSLYGAMYRRFLAVGGHVRGVLWYQGESDANPDAAPQFQDKFVAFVQAVRDDFKAPDLPFYYVQIGRFAVKNDPQWWDMVQEMQLKAESIIPHSGMVVSIDQPLDDPIHVSTAGHKVLARRLANRILSEVYGVENYKPGPRPATMAWHKTPFGPQLWVTFTGVNGALKAAGRVSGFSANKMDGTPLIYKQQLSPDDPNTVILWLAHKPEDGQLWYGHGLNPYCNVVDEAGFAVPVFGPLSLPK